MLKVLLVGDVGLGINGWYHVGDESMFFYNYHSLIKTGIFDVYFTSRSISHNILKHREILRINFTDNVRGFLKLLYLLLFSCFYHSQSNIAILLKTIKKMDHIVISGGGNINSIWSGHLYYRFLICFFAKKYKKPFFVSAQTIGPITNIIHRMMSVFLLKYAKIFAIRDRSFSLNFIDNKYLDNILYAYDDALNQRIITSSISFITKKENAVYVGLSLHMEEGSCGEIHTMQKCIREIVTYIKNPIFVLIPHVFDSFDNGDLSYMKQIISPLLDDCLEVNYLLLSEYAQKNNVSFELAVENITSEMDIVLCTRYHSAIFSLKHKIPCLMIGRNSYEIGKLRGLLDTLNIKEDVVIDLGNLGYQMFIDNFFKNFSKFKKIIVWSLDNLDYNMLFINKYILYAKNSIRSP